MLGITESEEDELLTLLLQIAEQRIMRACYPYASDDEISNLKFPTKYTFLKLDVSVRLYNERGAEGETSHSENGVVRSYENIDNFILKNIVPFCAVPIKAVNNEKS